MPKHTDGSNSDSNLEKWYFKSRIALNIAATIALAVATATLVVVTTVTLVNGQPSVTNTENNDTIRLNMIAHDVSDAVSTAVNAHKADNKAGAVIDEMYVDDDLPGSVKDGTPHGGHPSSTELMPYVVAVDDSCFKDMNAWIYVAGLTPNGTYHVQTDWTHTGSFGYGDSANVNDRGQATFAWPCYDNLGNYLPSNTYRVLITDQSGFAIMINIVFGDTPYHTPDSVVPTYYVATSHGK